MTRGTALVNGAYRWVNANQLSMSGVCAASGGLTVVPSLMEVLLSDSHGTSAPRPPVMQRDRDRGIWLIGVLPDIVFYAASQGPDNTDGRKPPTAGWVTQTQGSDPVPVVHALLDGPTASDSGGSSGELGFLLPS